MIGKYPLDRRPFWLARARHEIAVYRALRALEPLPVSMPELVAADPTHHLLVMTDLAGPPVQPHRYPQAAIPPGQLGAVLDLVDRLHAWRPAVPCALPSDEDYPRQLAAVRGSEINDIDSLRATGIPNVCESGCYPPCNPACQPNCSPV